MHLVLKIAGLHSIMLLSGHFAFLGLPVMNRFHCFQFQRRFHFKVFLTDTPKILGINMYLPRLTLHLSKGVDSIYQGVAIGLPRAYHRLTMGLP